MCRRQYPRNNLLRRLALEFQSCALPRHTRQKTQACFVQKSQNRRGLHIAPFAGTLAWLNNFLSRSGSLRGQLQALQGVKDRWSKSGSIRSPTVRLRYFQFMVGLESDSNMAQCRMCCSRGAGPGSLSLYSDGCVKSRAMLLVTSLLPSWHLFCTQRATTCARDERASEGMQPEPSRTRIKQES